MSAISPCDSGLQIHLTIHDIIVDSLPGEGGLETQKISVQPSPTVVINNQTIVS
jgi:hypothetical protein